MTQLDEINLQEFGGGRTEETMQLQRVVGGVNQNAGQHTFVLGDDSAKWTLNLQLAANVTALRFTVAGTTVTVNIPGGVSWLGPAGTAILDINGSDYKASFQR